MMSQSDILDEVKKTQTKIKDLGLPTASKEKEVDLKTGRLEPQEEKLDNKKAKQIVDEIIRELKIKKIKTQSHKDGDGLIEDYHVMMNEKRYILRLVLLYNTLRASLVLWDKGNTKLLDVIFIGPLKNHNYLKKYGLERLKTWTA